MGHGDTLELVISELVQKRESLAAATALEYLFCIHVCRRQDGAAVDLCGTIFDASATTPFAEWLRVT